MSKGAATRREVLGEALALASVVGLEGLTIGKLAEHVGMSKSGLFAHFASKDNLGVAILEEAVARFVATVVTPAFERPRGEPRLRALLENWFRWTKSDFLPGGCIFLSASIELDDKPGPARDALVAAQRDWIATLAGAARLAVSEGHFRSDVDPEQVAQEICSIAYGANFLGRLLRDPKAEVRAVRGIERVLEDARAPRADVTRARRTGHRPPKTPTARHEKR